MLCQHLGAAVNVDPVVREIAVAEDGDDVVPAVRQACGRDAVDILVRRVEAEPSVNKPQVVARPADNDVAVDSGPVHPECHRGLRVRGRADGQPRDHERTAAVHRSRQAGIAASAGVACAGGRGAGGTRERRSLRHAVVGAAARGGAVLELAGRAGPGRFLEPVFGHQHGRDDGGAQPRHRRIAVVDDAGVAAGGGAAAHAVDGGRIAQRDGRRAGGPDAGGRDGALRERDRARAAGDGTRDMRCVADVDGATGAGDAAGDLSRLPERHRARRAHRAADDRLVADADGTTGAGDVAADGVALVQRDRAAGAADRASHAGAVAQLDGAGGA